MGLWLKQDDGTLAEVSGGVNGGGGQPGIDGLPGADGNMWHVGSGEPSPTLGEPGDYYLDGEDGWVYVKRSDGSWTNLFVNLTGPAGANGTNGTDGAPGTNGTNGAKGDKGNPGTNGTNGAKGDKGNPGTNGTNGAKGATGPAGPTGPKGATGPAGPSSTFTGGTVTNNTTFNGEVYTNKWLRCKGQQGVYFTDYGGGWRMVDTSWVSSYGGKGVQSIGGGMAASGLVESSGTNGYGTLMVNHDWTFFAKYMSVRRIKDRIAPMSDSVAPGEVIDMLNPVTFIERKRGDGPEAEAVKQYRENATIWGFVAEEVCDVDAATGARLGSYELTEDKTGFQPAGWSVQPMVALLVAEAKQLRSRVAELESQLTDMSERIGELENRQ